MTIFGIASRIWSPGAPELLYSCILSKNGLYYMFVVKGFFMLFASGENMARIMHVSSDVTTEFRSRQFIHLQASGKMTRTNLRLSIFEVQRLRNTVGQGLGSPYKILAFSSNSLGMIGTVIDPSKQAAANGNFPVPDPAVATSWLQRVRTFFALQQNDHSKNSRRNRGHYSATALHQRNQLLQ